MEGENESELNKAQLRRKFKQERKRKAQQMEAAGVRWAPVPTDLDAMREAVNGGLFSLEVIDGACVGASAPQRTDHLAAGIVAGAAYKNLVGKEQQARSRGACLGCCVGRAGRPSSPRRSPSQP